MATSKTPRRKAATEAASAEPAPATKKPAAKAAKAVKPVKPVTAAKAAKAEPSAKASKPAAKRPAVKAAAPVEAPAVKKAARKVASQTAAKAPAAASKTAAVKKSAAKPVEAAADKATGKSTGKATAKATTKATPKAATRATTKATEEVATKAVTATVDKPAKKVAKKVAKKAEPALEQTVAATAEAPSARPVRKRKVAEIEVPEAPAAEAAQPARKTRKGGAPAVAAPVAALVAEVAAALEEPGAPVARKRGKALAAPVVEMPAVAEPAETRPARKTRPPKKPPALPAVDLTGADSPEEGAEDAVVVVEPQGPDWQWHKPQPGLFGRYAIQDAEGTLLASLDLQGGVGHYHCNCAEFLDSEEGACAHGQWLIGQLSAAREGLAGKLASGPDTPWSELGLSAGWERRLVWRLGQGASPALRSLAEDCADEQGRFIAPLEGQVLPTLLQAAAAEGHELRVGAEVWQQLALSADAGDRVERLAQAFEQGLDSPALHALVRTPLPEQQWEAALFAVCAGRALLADESPLPQRPSAIVAAQLWQSRFDLGAVAIVAPAVLHEAWLADVARLLGAWPAGWTLVAPGELAPAAGCELLIVDAIDALGDALPALRQLGAAQLILLAHQELLGTELLAPLVAWIDEARRGPYAALRRLGAEAGKRQQREVLETVMLARRRRDLAAGLPAQLLTHWVRVPAQDCAGLVLVPGDVQALRRLHERWSRVGSLSAGEQLQLQQALLRLRQGQTEQMGEARAAALVRLLPELVPGRAERVVVFAQQDLALRPLALALQDLGLPLANLRQHQSAEVRAMELQAWAEGEASVLLATDAACAGLDLRQPGSVLVHADLCWNPALMSERLARLGAEGAGVPAWALVLESGFDPAQLAAHAQEASLPAGLQDGEAGAIPFLAGEDLAAFMAAVGRALDLLRSA